ncbi:hypothetical protein B6N60_00151 [Richelia sinica FACHB-800]|uniref:DUF676 domain-containing protein n=1 Tax=Richelia sinica FACHB-800 TaxID=1357546 RepID=A0A975T4X4_9NOST|nr:hypothetical protein [Richelia sinica]MBD2666535.1 hypothetical protein [Richelia sinica FACHB-800]QXE21476.1 hypothetical protein B6N60_00151 [Richelia sinica FACHB-800]
MLVFFIHGVSTKNSTYAEALIKNIKKQVRKTKVETSLYFYSSFWGNLFNHKKHQFLDYIDKDYSRACQQHPEYKFWHDDIYRYRSRRKELIRNFLGDFLIYQNPKRGQIIRKQIFEEFNQFIQDHPKETQIHFIAHSLGSLILWDILFSDVISNDDSVLHFRDKLHKLDLVSITTLGSPLLFLKEMLDIDFSIVNAVIDKSSKNYGNGYKLRWLNIIHSSDLMAYPLKASIENEINSDLLFCDQYVWQDANGTELTLRNMGQSDMAMVIAAEDAHSSYFYDTLDGAITARIISYNLLGEINKLLERCITPKLN